MVGDGQGLVPRVVELDAHADHVPCALLAHGHLRDVGLEGAGVEAVRAARTSATAAPAESSIRVAIGAGELRALLDTLNPLLGSVLYLLCPVLNRAGSLLHGVLYRAGALLNCVLGSLRSGFLHLLPEALLLLRLALLGLLLVWLLVLSRLSLGLGLCLRDRDAAKVAIVTATRVAFLTPMVLSSKV